ncbi:MAG: hypothetical protein J2O38_07025, partial [Acidimicrobiales bacterium]|nr:hypothetical protein [Acidimicrobiales bacterium]
MSSSIGVNTGGPAQTLIANLKKTIDNGNTTKQALSAATQQIPTAWAGPAAQNWRTDAQSTITSLGSFLQETQA